MRVTLVKIGEPMPGEGFRTLRMTSFVNALLERGHKPRWITSDWNHQKKHKRDIETIRKAVKRDVELTFLEAPGYRRNISLARILHHHVFSRKLGETLDKGAKPDLIWACFPTIPTANVVSLWAGHQNVPVIFEVRDLSPDIFVEHSPNGLKTISKLLTKPLRSIAGRAFASSAGLVGVSRGYLDWPESLALEGGRLPSYRGVFPIGYDSVPILNDQNQFFSESDKRLPLKERGCLFFIYVGSFGHSYDIDTVVDAAIKAERDGLHCKIVIAGGGCKKKERALRRVASISKTLIYTGWLNSHDLGLMLTQSDVGLMAYNEKATQGLPNKIYEYMGNGLMVLSSLKGEAEQFINDWGIGWNYNPRDPDSLFELIKWSINEKDLVREYGRRAKQIFEKRFRSESNSLKMVSFAEKVVREY